MPNTGMSQKFFGFMASFLAVRTIEVGKPLRVIIAGIWLRCKVTSGRKDRASIICCCLAVFTALTLQGGRGLCTLGLKALWGKLTEDFCTGGEVFCDWPGSRAVLWFPLIEV